MKTIKKIGLLFLMILSFISGLLIGKSFTTKTNALYYDNGQYVSSNIGYFEYHDTLIETEYEDVTAFYFDSQGAGLYLLSEDLEFNLLYTQESNPEIYYYTFEYDNADNFPYIYVEWDMDYGTIEYWPNEDESGIYTLSFMVKYVHYNTFDRYFLYNFMLNKGNYIEYEPPGKIYSGNIENGLGAFSFGTLKSGLYDEDTGEVTNQRTLQYDIVNGGFLSKNWYLEDERVTYAILVDYGNNGLDFSRYNTLNILNGNTNDYIAYLKFGQQIIIEFKNYTYIVNGADSAERVAYIDMEQLKGSYGNVVYKIIFTGYGEDYLPGGLSTDTYYVKGYENGYNNGKTEGYHNGYSTGSNVGYENGYQKGLQEGQTQHNKALGIARAVLGFISDFTAIEILPGIRIIYLLGLVVMVGVFKWIIGLANGK